MARTLTVLVVFALALIACSASHGLELPGVVSVKSFGAVGDGIADDTRAIQAAIDCVRHKGGTVYLPVGTYSITSLDLTNIGCGFTLIGEGPNSTRLMPAGDGEVVLDLTGSRFVKLESFQLGAYNQEHCPSVGILLAQVASGVSNAVHFQRLYISGRYSVATLYCYGVPSSTMDDCDFYNYQDAPVPVVAFTERNYAGVKSLFTTVFTGPSNTSDWTLTGCEIHELSRTKGKTVATALRLEGTMQMRWIGGNISGAGPQLVHLSHNTRYTVFQGTTFYSENGTPPDALFHNSDRTSCLIVTGCLPQASRAIFTGSSTAVYDEVDFACKPSANGFDGLIFDCPGGTLSDSTIRCDGFGLKLAKITDTLLIHPGQVDAPRNEATVISSKDRAAIETN